MRYVAAYAAVVRGDRVSASRLCDDLLDEDTDATVPQGDLLVRLAILTDTCRQLGHVPGMRFCVRQLQPHRGHHAIFPFSQYLGSVDLALGSTLARLGELDEGISTLTSAVQQHRDTHTLVSERSAHQALTEAYERRGRPDDRDRLEHHRAHATRIDAVIHERS